MLVKMESASGGGGSGASGTFHVTSSEEIIDIDTTLGSNLKRFAFAGLNTTSIAGGHGGTWAIWDSIQSSIYCAADNSSADTGTNCVASLNSTVAGANRTPIIVSVNNGVVRIKSAKSGNMNGNDYIWVAE